MKKLYVCNPSRNAACEKSFCYERGGPCGLTSDVRAALRDLLGRPMESIEIEEEKPDGKTDGP